MKKALSIVLCIVMVLSMVSMTAVAAGEDVVLTVTADKQDANRGDTVAFTVTLAPISKGTASFSFNLDIPEGLTYVANSAKFSDAVKTSMGVKEADNWAENVLMVAVYGLGDGYTATTDTVMLTFDCTVAADAKGTKSVGLKNVEFYDANDAAMTAASTPVSVTALKGNNFTPASIDVTYGALAITDKSAKSVTPVATGKDTDNDDLPASELAKITYAFKGTAPAGLSIDAKTGAVTVTDAAKAAAGDVTVTATLGSITKDATIAVTKADPAAQSITFKKGGTALAGATDTVVKPVDATNVEVTYTAVPVDQYGAEMAAVALTKDTSTSDAAFADGKVTVTKDTTEGDVVLKATAGTVNATLTVKVTNISFEGVDAGVKATDGVYGAKMSDLVKVDGSKITATAGAAVAGTYSVVDKDTVPAAADAVAYTVVFNSTDGTYKNITVKEGTVKVAKKALTVTAKDIDVKVGAEIDPAEQGYEVEGLVGTDALEGTAVYKFYKIGDDDVVSETETAITAIGTEEPAEYAIKVTGLTASENYDMTTVDGTLTIKKRTTFVPGVTTSPVDTPVTITRPDGTKVTVTVKDGQVSADVVVPSRLDSTVVVIPMEGADNSVVPVIVDKDGNETIVKLSVAEEDGVALVLEESATVKLVKHDHHFTDTTGHWAEPYVHFVHSRQLFNGTSETTFEPNTAMNRAMIATVLYRLDGENKTDVAAAFNDVAADTWYTDGVAWAAEKEIVKGLGEGVFAPDDNVTREQLAVMIYRYAGSPDVTSVAAMADFADVASVSDWADAAMRWAVQKGIINGKDGNRLDPQGNATRAEVATILQRFVALNVQ